MGAHVSAVALHTTHKVVDENNNRSDFEFSRAQVPQQGQQVYHHFDFQTNPTGGKLTKGKDIFLSCSSTYPGGKVGTLNKCKDGGELSQRDVTPPITVNGFDSGL